MATRKDLEAQLERDPHDAAAFLVYADLLLELGDPHGELIRVQHALSHAPDDAELKERNEALQEQLMRDIYFVKSRWELGFPREVELTWITDELVPTVVSTLRTPLMRFVEKLVFSDYVVLRPLAELLSSLKLLTHIVLISNLELVAGSKRLSEQLDTLAQATRLKRLTLRSRRTTELMAALPSFPTSSSSHSPESTCFMKTSPR